MQRGRWIPWAIGLILVVILVGVALSHNLTPDQKWICSTDHQAGVAAPSYCS